MKHSAAADSKTPNLDVNMFYRPIRFDTPALDAVKVIELDGRILRDPSRPGRLRFAFFINGSAQQDRRLAIPLPGKTEASERLGQDGRREGGRRPAFPSIRGNFHLGNPA